MKLVLPWFCPVSRLVEELFKIDFQGEFEAVVALRGGGQNIPITCQRLGGPYLDYGITLGVVLVALQLQV